MNTRKVHTSKNNMNQSYELTLSISRLEQKDSMNIDFRIYF